MELFPASHQQSDFAIPLKEMGLFPASHQQSDFAIPLKRNGIVSSESPTIRLRHTLKKKWDCFQRRFKKKWYCFQRRFHLQTSIPEIRPIRYDQYALPLIGDHFLNLLQVACIMISDVDVKRDAEIFIIFLLIQHALS